MWLEQLALSLVGDPHEARDLAQSTWLAALRSGDKPQVSRRAWLVGTLRRLRAYGLRSSKRREAREEWAARSESTPSVLDLTARAEQHERLLAFVRGLPELYRGPLLLRYVDGLEPRYIADRLHLKVRTVHTRLHRGLELLRERMDSNHPEGREGWVSALLLAWRGRVQSPPDTRSRTHWLQPIGLVAGASIVAWAVASGPASGRLGAPESIGALFPKPQDSELAEIGSSIRSRPSTHVEAKQIHSIEGKPIHGRVIHWDGSPVAGAKIELRAQAGFAFGALSGEPVELRYGPRAVLAGLSGRDGSFQGIGSAASWVHAVAPGHVVALAAEWKPADQERELRVVLAPSEPLQRRVQTLEGEPIAGAEAWITLDENIDQRFPFSFARVHPMHWKAVSQSDGLLSGCDVPMVPDAYLRLRASGYEDLEVRWLELPPGPIRLAPLENLLHGVALGPNGAPLPGAHVSASGQWARSNSNGEFLLRVSSTAPIDLFGAAAGLAPKRLEVHSAGDAPVIQLDQPARTLRGRFIDRLGLGIAGIDVALVDPTVTVRPDVPLVLESVSAGDAGFLHRATSDAMGEFALAGIGNRPRKLRVFDRRTALVYQTAPLSPDQDHELALPEELLLPQVGGRLVSPQGNPLEGVSVSVEAHSYLLDIPGQPSPMTLAGSGAATKTDARGAFTLQNVPYKDVWLRIGQAGRVTRQIPIDPDQPIGIEIILPRTMALAVELITPRGGEVMELLDRTGQRVHMQRIQALTRKAFAMWNFVSASSPTFEVPETASTLVLRVPGNAPLHVPLSLEAGGTLRLRL